MENGKRADAAREGRVALVNRVGATWDAPLTGLFTDIGFPEDGMWGILAMTNDCLDVVVFDHPNEGDRVNYRVRCDGDWETRAVGVPIGSRSRVKFKARRGSRLTEKWA